MGTGSTADRLVAFRVQAPTASEDDVVAALWDRGTTGVHVQPGPAGAVVLLAYFAERPGLGAELAVSLGPLGVTTVEPTAVPEVDWVSRYRAGFRAFNVGGFQVVPPWEPEPEGLLGGHVLRILPGRAFGTGTHETTRLCLEALDELAARRPLGRVVDLGAGTGILAIAAAHLGARTIIAVDIDPDAVESAQLHARLNAVDLRLVRGDLGQPLAPGRFDVVLANLTAPLLQERRDEILGLCVPSAALVLAGFLREEADAVVHAYARFGRHTLSFDGEWAALLVEAGA